ncbi:MAG: hypothetical protein ACI4NQ_00975 [Christensenellales bacterium]
MIINKYTCTAAPRQMPERIHFQNAVSRAAKAARQTKHIMSQHQLQEFLSFKLAALRQQGVQQECGSSRTVITANDAFCSGKDMRLRNLFGTS